MRDDVRRDLDRSTRAFETIVWPEIAPYVGGGTLQSLASGDDVLDRTGGIDALQVLRTGIRTIAHRTQFDDDYRKPATFTIRYARRSHAATECEKRCDAINHGYEIPSLVIQAYVHERQRQFVRAAIVHGRPFYEYVFADLARWQPRTTTDGTVFLVVPWVQISIDNSKVVARDWAGRPAKYRSEVPLLAKDGLGVVHRTPDSFFREQGYESFFDRDDRFFSHTRRNHKLLWI